MVSDLTLLGDLLMQKGELAESIEILTEAASLVDSIRIRAGSDGRRREFALADRHATYRFLIAALLRRDHQGDAEAAFLYAESARARSLNDRLQQQEEASQLPTEVVDLLAEEDRLLLPPGHQLSPLPGTRAEAKAIASLFGPEGVWFAGKDTTAWQVREAAPRYRIQHWATHCLLDETDPDFSGLVVSPPAAQAPGGEVVDDLVTVHDLARLSLRADLVVCSACQTGLGVVRAGEGAIGISQALLAAGARCVVLSLWPVPDRPTRRLMLAFYKALRRGEPPADALREAKAEVRRRYPLIY